MQSAISPEMEELLIYLATITLNDSPSTPHWIVNGRAHRSFVSSIIYHSYELLVMGLTHTQKLVQEWKIAHTHIYCPRTIIPHDVGL